MKNQKEYVDAINSYIWNEGDAFFYFYETIFLNVTQFYQY